MIKWIFLYFLFFCAPAFAQFGNGGPFSNLNNYFRGDKTTAPSCSTDGWTYINTTNNGYYICYASSWTLLATLIYVAPNKNIYNTDNSQIYNTDGSPITYQ